VSVKRLELPVVLFLPEDRPPSRYFETNPQIEGSDYDGDGILYQDPPLGLLMA